MIHPKSFRKPFLLLVAVGMAAAPTTTSALENEQLRYTINWPSGLSLGEAQLAASTSKSAEGKASLHLSFDIDAGIPGFAVSDRYRSEPSGEFCSGEFHKQSTHGSKKTDEKLTFDAETVTVKRQTAGGGESQVSTAQCPKDALTFLYFVRHELSQGRIPPPQTVWFGSPYEVHLEFTGTQTIRIQDHPVEADRVAASAKGPTSGIAFEVFFLKDRTHTPALVRVPLALGTFSMELER